jgi:hypothetical protein
MTPRRVVAKVEWHPGELYPRVGFIVTNMTRPAERVVAFYNQRGTAEQWINTVKWTRLSCCSFAATPSGFSFMRWPTISPTSLGRPLDRQIARPRTHFCRNRRHLSARPRLQRKESFGVFGQSAVFVVQERPD